MNILSRMRSSLRSVLPVKRIEHFAIAIYTGPDPFHLTAPAKIKNPVLTNKSVTDARALFIADPFMLYEKGKWYMFAEIYNAGTRLGEIALATSSDGMKWTYRQIVLAESFHMSYPYVFIWEDAFYMLVESRTDSVRLYRATDFPYRWTHVKTLLDGADFRDASIFRHDGRWWMFACPGPKDDILNLYYAEDLLGPWHPHPANPIVQNDARIARPSGRVIEWNGRIFRFAQDDLAYYGHRVWALEVTSLSTTSYQECMATTLPLLEPSGRGWNARGMHHIDLHQVSSGQWIACVDGFKPVFCRKSDLSEMLR